jgi:membrane protein YdbS with pleckstrin-like domain
MSAAYEGIKGWLFQVFRVEPEPHPPFGSPGSLRVFRAGRTYYRLRIVLWGLRQAGILVGFIIGVALAHRFLPRVIPIHYDAHGRHDNWNFHALGLLAIVEPIALIAALVQAPITWAAVRLRYELRCYMVTDRSLRIRDGLATLRELTLSFANVQQIQVEQGPIQRFLGLSDVVVTSAGGGGQSQGVRGMEKGRHRESFHAARFGDVDNAEEIRDLIISRLRAVRDAGLGDPDDRPVSASTAETLTNSPALTPPRVMTAAHQVLGECRALRAAILAGEGAEPG